MINPLFAQAAKQNEGYNGEYNEVVTEETQPIVETEDVQEVIEA